MIFYCPMLKLLFRKTSRRYFFFTYWYEDTWNWSKANLFNGSTGLAGSNISIITKEEIAKSKHKTIGDDAAKEALKKAKEWQKKKAEAGLAAILWPKEFGGYGGTPIEQVIYQQ